MYHPILPTRRQFIAGAAALGALTGRLRAAPVSQVPRFNLLYSNDTTNIFTVTSPYHRYGQPLESSMIDASIDEAAVADVQIIQPGLGWVPLWCSKSYPIERHAAWFAARTGIPVDKIPNSYIEYMLQGGDILGEFVQHCRAIGRYPIASLRLNDVQALPDMNGHDGSAAWTSQFYIDHPEYRLGPELPGMGALAQNWAIPEVRAVKYNYLKEMIEGYDVAGVELDFMRTEVFFRPSETNSTERRKIMTGFVAAIRQLLNRKSRGQRNLALCVRVPAVVDFLDEMGLDIGSLAAAGVDVFTLSSSFFTSQRFDIEAYRAAAPGAQMFVELTHASAGIKEPRLPHDPGHTRTTDVQFLSTASEAAHRGANGVALFNFAYYRTQGSVDLSVGREPSFGLLPQLANPGSIPPGPRWWFISQGWRKALPTRNDFLPRWIDPRKALVLDLYAERPQRDGVLRLRGEAELNRFQPTVMLNGRGLTPMEPDERLFAAGTEAGEGPEDEYLYYRCPAVAVINGMNRVIMSHQQERMLINECDLRFG